MPTSLYFIAHQPAKRARLTTAVDTNKRNKERKRKLKNQTKEQIKSRREKERIIKKDGK